MYTKEDCGYCTQAKQILRDAGIPFNELKLHQDFPEGHIKALYPEASTYPVIVVDDFHIGGYEELRKRLNEELTDQRRLLLEDE
jgi:glutaredoxin